MRWDLESYPMARAWDVAEKRRAVQEFEAAVLNRQRDERAYQAAKRELLQQLGLDS